MSWSLADEGARPEAVLIVASGPTEADGGTAVVRPELATGEVPQSARVVGLRNGVRYGFVVIPVSVLGAAEASAPVYATPTSGVDGEVAGLIVNFAEGHVPASGSSDVPGEQGVDQVGLQVAGEVGDQTMLVEFTESVDVSTATQVARDLAADPAVEWAEPDLFVSGATAPSTTSPSSGDQWNLDGEFGIGLSAISEAAGNSETAADAQAGQGVTVAVIDTGMTEHPELAGRLVGGYDFVSSPAELAADRAGDGSSLAFDGDYVDTARFGGPGRDANPADPGDWRSTAPARSSTWHGTKVAGVISAVAPAARIQPVRALSWRGGLLSDIAASVTWASGGSIDGVPANATPSTVINLSFSVQTPCPRSLQDAIDGARGRGAVLVAAAGNAGTDAGAYAPGNCTGVITTGATGIDGKRAAYSNHGAVVDISAPGSAIATTSNTGTQGPDAPATADADGTSIAAAHVSAAAARYRSTSTGSTPDQVTEYLTGKAVRAFPGDTCDDTLTTSCGTGILTLAQPSTNVTVTYFDPRSGQSATASVDPASFTPATASSLGLPGSWSDVGGTYAFATWTDGGCSTTNVPCTPLGNYYDPGVATTLTGNITLYAIYGPNVSVSLQCPVSGTTLTTFTVPRWSLTSAFPNPTNQTTASPAGCVGWDLRYYHVGTTWQGYQAFRGQEVATGGRFRNTSTFAATFIPQYDLVPMKVYFKVNGGTGTMDQTALSPGDANGDYQTGTFYPTQTTGVQWAWNLSKSGHYYSAANALPFWTIEGVTSSPKMCGNSRSNYPADCSSSVAFFHPDILNQSQWGPLTNATERSFTLVANYVPAWYVTYDANGGTGAPADSADKYPYGSSSATVYSYVTLSSTRPTRTGYTFLGWNTAANGSGTMYQPLSSVSNNTSGAKALYAQWSQNYYTLRFSDSAGSSVPTNVQFAGNSSFLLPTQVPSRRGYIFTGWNTQSNGSGTTYAAGASYPGALSDAYLYAQWTPGTYTVTFDLNDADGGSTTASGRPSAATGATDSSIIISGTPPTRVGYTFGGWTTQASGAGTTYAAGATFPLGADDHTIYAKWTAKTYTLTAYANAGTAGEVWRSATVTFDTTVTPFSGYAAPNWNPAVFEGLNSAADGSGTSYPGTTARSGGTPASTDASFTINSSFIPGSGTAISVYAQYAYPFTFYRGPGATFGYGAVISSNQYASLNTPGYPNRPIVPSATAPSVTGYAFVGWTSDAGKSGTAWTSSDTRYASGDVFTFPAGSTALNPGGVREAQSLYAMYAPNTYLLSFDTQGGSAAAPLSFSTGGSVTLPAAPTKSGDTFRNWNTAADGTGTSYAAGATYTPGVTQNVTLYASWKLPQTITFADPGNFTFTPSSSSISISPSASSGLSVTVTTSNSAVCTASASQITFVSAGTCIVTAAQAGNSTYAAASSVSHSLLVTAAAQVISVEISGYRTVSGSQVAINGVPLSFAVSTKAGGTAPQPYTGLTTSLTATPSGVCTIGTSSINGSGLVTGIAITKVGPGVCTITASNSGGVGSGGTPYAAASTSAQVIFQAPQTVSFPGANSEVALGAGSFNADVIWQSSATFGSGNGNALVRAVKVASGAVVMDGGSPNMPVPSDVCTVGSQVSASGTTHTLNITLQSTGTCALNYYIPEDANYETASRQTYGQLGIFTVVPGFTLTLNANGGTVGSSSIPAAQNSSITLPSPTRAGYTFMGWQDPSSNLYSAGTTTWTGSSAVTLTAQWRLIESQSIVFADPGVQRLPSTFTISATTNSGLDVTFTVSPGATSVCALVSGVSNVSTLTVASGATVTVNPLTRGTCTITASRGAGVTGSGLTSREFSAAADVPYAISILGRLQTITFADPADQAFDYGATFTVSPTVDSGRTATLTTSTPTICAVSGPLSGTWTITQKLAGTCVLTASEAGTVTTWAPATSVSQSVVFTADPLRDGGGAIVETAPGDANYVVNGNVTDTCLQVSGSGDEVIAGDGPIAAADGQYCPGPNVPIDIALEGATNDAAYINPQTAVLTFISGKDGIVSGEGFQAASIVEIWVFSTPRFLGYATVQSDGTFSQQFTVPTDLTPGDHSIQAEGLAIDNVRRAVNAGVEVIADPNASSSNPSSNAGGAATAGASTSGTGLSPTGITIGNDGQPVIPPAEVATVAKGDAVYIEEDGSLRRTPQILRDTTTGEPWLTAGTPGDLVIALRGNEQGATTYDEPNSRLVFHLDKKGEAEGSGFMPGTEAEVWMFSTPKYLGTTKVRADGSWTIDFVVPPDLEIGSHSIQAEGIAPDGQERSVRAFVLVDREIRPAVARPRIVTKQLVVTFERMSAKVDARQAARLTRVMKQDGLYRVRTTGYVQASGSSINDRDLSSERAGAVAAFIDRRRLALTADSNVTSKAKGRRTAAQQACALVSNRCVVVTLTYRR